MFIIEYPLLLWTARLPDGVEEKVWHTSQGVFHTLPTHLPRSLVLERSKDRQSFLWVQIAHNHHGEHRIVGRGKDAQGKPYVLESHGLLADMVRYGYLLHRGLPIEPLSWTKKIVRRDA